MVDSTPTGVGAAVDDEVDAAAQIGRAHARRVVGDTWPERLADGATTGLPNAARDRARTGWSGTRTAIVSSPAVASSATGQAGALRQHQRQRPRPERRGEPLGVGIEARRARARPQVGHMGDQRIEGRPALGLVEARDRLAVGRVGAEPVDRLGREGDEAAGRSSARRPRSPPRRPSACASRAAVITSRVPDSEWSGRLRPAAGGYKPALGSRSVAQSGSAPRSGRGGRRFKSCHSDQHLADFITSSATGYATASRGLRCRAKARLAPARWSGW